MTKSTCSQTVCKTVHIAPTIKNGDLDTSNLIKTTIWTAQMAISIINMFNSNWLNS